MSIICRPKYDIEFNHDCWGNGMWYYHNEQYIAERDSDSRIRVHNRGGFLLFSEEEFWRCFIKTTMTKTDVINMIDCMRDGENKSYERCSINEQRTHDHVVINAVYDHIIDNLNMLFPDE